MFIFIVGLFCMAMSLLKCERLRLNAGVLSLFRGTNVGVEASKRQTAADTSCTAQVVPAFASVSLHVSRPSSVFYVCGAVGGSSRKLMVLNQLFSSKPSGIRGVVRAWARRGPRDTG